MEVNRKTALEIFGLNQNANKEDINKSFKRLSKRVHPDTGGDENLFKFILYCKEVLLSGKSQENTSENYNYGREEHSKNQKERGSLSLKTLYDVYGRLYKITEEYDITHIRNAMVVYITPCKKKKLMECISLQTAQPFYEFQELGFARFIANINIPENLKKFKKFNIRVEMMGKKFEFKVSMKKPHYILEYSEIFGFKTVVEFKFK